MPIMRLLNAHANRIGLAACIMLPYWSGVALRNRGIYRFSAALVTQASRRAQSISDSPVISNFVKGKIAGAVSGSAKSIRRGELGLNRKPRHFKPFVYFDHTRLRGGP